MTDLTGIICDADFHQICDDEKMINLRKIGEMVEEYTEHCIQELKG